MKIHQGLIIVVFIAFSVWSADTTRILWLGNSISYNAGSLSKCLKERPLPVYEEYGTYIYDITDEWENWHCDSSATWDPRKNYRSIKSGKWDIVFVQALGRDGTNLRSYSLKSYETMLNAIRGVHAVVDSGGAKMILLHAWGTKDRVPQWDTLSKTWKPDVMDSVEAGIRGLCVELGVSMIPIGPAQWEVQKRDKSIQLYSDWIHGAEAGLYLGRLVTFSAFTGQDPHGFGNFYALDSEVQFFMQQIAWETVFKTSRASFEPFVLGARPRNVEDLNVYPENRISSIEQYLSVNILGDIRFTGDSLVTGTNHLLYRSLTPDILYINHFGRCMAKQVGQGKIEVVCGGLADTLVLDVTASTAVFDSIRITPHALSGYAVNGYAFSASAYSHHQGQPIVVNASALVEWKSSAPDIFTLSGGKILKQTAQGGNQFAAIAYQGLADTVHFVLLQDLPVLMRINFQVTDTGYNSFWSRDIGKPYSESSGFGWYNTPYTQGMERTNAIYYDSAFFLTNTVRWPVAGSTSTSSPIVGSYKINCPDGDYIVKIGLGHPTDLNLKSYVVFGEDTLFKHVTSTGHMVEAKTDTVELHGLAGLVLKIYGPIAYLVVVTKAGVNIDSVAYDTPPLPVSSAILDVSAKTTLTKMELVAFPNPFNPSVTIRVNSGLGSAQWKAMIFDVAGKTVACFQGKGKEGNAQFIWNASGFPSGLYTVKWLSEKRTFYGRLILMK